MAQGMTCAWCGRVVRQGEPVSHGICPTCYADQEGIEIEDVLAMSPELADRLPWGRIVLRGPGEIVEFNATESRLAHRRAEDVLGKNFFRDVAPCTRVQEFEGRLAAMRASRADGRAQFEFVFRFPADEALVTVHMVYVASTDVSVLLIGREA